MITHYDSPNKIDCCILDANSKIKVLIKTAEISLGGFVWRDEYEKDEMIFCREVLTPLYSS